MKKFKTTLFQKNPYCWYAVSLDEQFKVEVIESSGKYSINLRYRKGGLKSIDNFTFSCTRHTVLEAINEIKKWTVSV